MTEEKYTLIMHVFDKDHIPKANNLLILTKFGEWHIGHFDGPRFNAPLKQISLEEISVYTHLHSGNKYLEETELELPNSIHLINSRP